MRAVMWDVLCLWLCVSGPLSLGRSVRHAGAGWLTDVFPRACKRGPLSIPLLPIPGYLWSMSRINCLDLVLKSIKIILATWIPRESLRQGFEGFIRVQSSYLVILRWEKTPNTKPIYWLKTMSPSGMVPATGQLRAKVCLSKTLCS